MSHEQNVFLLRFKTGNRTSVARVTPELHSVTTAAETQPVIKLTDLARRKREATSEV